MELAKVLLTVFSILLPTSVFLLSRDHPKLDIAKDPTRRSSLTILVALGFVILMLLFAEFFETYKAIHISVESSALDDVIALGIFGMFLGLVIGMVIARTNMVHSGHLSLGLKLFRYVIISIIVTSVTVAIMLNPTGIFEMINTVSDKDKLAEWRLFTSFIIEVPIILFCIGFIYGFLSIRFLYRYAPSRN